MWLNWKMPSLGWRPPAECLPGAIPPLTKHSERWMGTSLLLCHTLVVRAPGQQARVA